jgi:asparagine synthase (glutamine-hydrolysing)
MLFGWCGDTAAGSFTPADLMAMGEALRVHQGQAFRVNVLPGLAIGQYALPPLDGEALQDVSPALSDDRQFALWMAGEAFAWPSHGLRGSSEAVTPAFRRRLLDVLRREGASALADLDGEYQVALWDASSRTLRLWSDRFASLPLYWSPANAGVAFAGGVRGVLAAPGVSREPDVDALREAVSFGGFRLGGRTNMRHVQMAPPAAALTIMPGECRVARYWQWDELDLTPRDDGRLLDDYRAAWRAAVARRLEGSARPGLTLSGGLDSRAILAEASRQRRRPHALSYGVRACDDVRFARRAASVAGAPLTVHELYGEGWFERRLGHIPATDGLIELVDLMHLEALPAMPPLYDLYLSGYVGDVVSGGTYDAVLAPQQLLRALPYYGGTLGLPLSQAEAMAEQMLSKFRGRPRLLLFEHKLPQAIARLTDAARPYVRVRRPFVDYALFEMAQRIPEPLRAASRWHERWLLSTYPEFYARIPNQKTGVAISASAWRRRATRGRRFVWRKTLGALSRAGLPVTVPQRSFHPDEPHWRVPIVREAIEGTVMSARSIACAVFGRQSVRTVLDGFFERNAVAIQVVGALFVFEHYHEHVGQWLADARRRTEIPAW